MSTPPYGRVLLGNEDVLRRSYATWEPQPVDQEIPVPDSGFSEMQRTTIVSPASVTGPGTFFGKAQRTLTFRPSQKPGWWLKRSDLPDSLPIYVSAENVWTTVRNIVLRSGSPHNYMRMVEHIIALKCGMGLDDVIIESDSGDPPLFDRSSMDLVEAVEKSGLCPLEAPSAWVTVKEPVSVVDPRGGFLVFMPAENGRRQLHVDCAIDFPNAIGRQRIRFPVDRDTFRHGAAARTNTTFFMMLYCKTVGKIFADVRHLGYTKKNILVAGKRKYVNEPQLIHNGKSLEAVWHRATLDLLAAVALIGHARLAGRILSYKAGHALDCLMITKLYQHELLEPVVVR